MWVNSPRLHSLDSSWQWSAAGSDRSTNESSRSRILAWLEEMCCCGIYEVKGIVYDKHNCRIVGFVDLGEVNNAMLSFERSAHQNSDFPMAKHILMFFVRGIFIRLKFPTRDLSLFGKWYKTLNVLDLTWCHWQETSFVHRGSLWTESFLACINQHLQSP